MRWSVLARGARWSVSSKCDTQDLITVTMPLVPYRYPPFGISIFFNACRKILEYRIFIKVLNYFLALLIFKIIIK